MIKDLSDDEISNALEKIYLRDQYESSPIIDELLNRQFVWPYLETSKDKTLLFVGINPSYIEANKKVSLKGYPILTATEDRKGHFGQFAKTASSANLNNKWACLDLFYFRETNQKRINGLIQEKSGLSFVCEQLKLTQIILEKIRPKIIVVANASARRFFGIDKNKVGKNIGVWMGYDFEPIKEFNNCYKIIGLNPLSICYNELKQTQLIDTVVVFSTSFLYMPRVNRETLIEKLRILSLEI